MLINRTIVYYYYHNNICLVLSQDSKNQRAGDYGLLWIMGYIVIVTHFYYFVPYFCFFRAYSYDQLLVRSIQLSLIIIMIVERYCPPRSGLIEEDMIICCYIIIVMLGGVVVIKTFNRNNIIIIIRIIIKILL